MLSVEGEDEQRFVSAFIVRIQYLLYESKEPEFHFYIYKRQPLQLCVLLASHAMPNYDEC